MVFTKDDKPALPERGPDGQRFMYTGQRIGLTAITVVLNRQEDGEEVTSTRAVVKMGL